ncbi:SGNH/GDSL hydrolase family protein [Curtobacterium sp. 22159]|uniref:SGNH/GDSL hydrolase family protein n=1 Tax=Curtobacterium sp. 22159 TaxID=3453882 RepID=UPI003F82633D
MICGTRSLLATVTALAAVLALGACAEDATVAATPTSVVTRTARPWDRAPGARVVVIGDSITGGHGLADGEAWPAMLAKQERWQLTNLSCDGAGVLTAGDGDACDSTYEALVQRAVDLRPAVVLVQASSNDLGQDDDEVDGASEELVADVHRLLPHARVIGLSAIWAEQAPPDQLASISDALRSAVQEEGGTFVDIGEPLRGHPEWMQSDDVHPTSRGQRAIEAAVAAAFARDDVQF